MALPVMTPEQRAAALEKAAAVRTARSALKAELKAGTLTLTEVLDRADDPIVGRARVLELVRTQKGVGAVKALAVLEGAGIDEKRRVAALTDKQRAALLEGLTN